MLIRKKEEDTGFVPFPKVFMLFLSCFGYEAIMEIVVILIVVLGLLFDYTNGFHDAANVVSTVIATRVLAPVSAIVMAGVLNFLGATQISGVAQTITSGLIDSQAATQIIVLAAVTGAIIWNLLTWYYGIPSSSSYALVGGLLGSALASPTTQKVLWGGVLNKVLIPMVLSPLLGFVLSYLLMKFLQFLFRKDSVAHELSIFRHLQIGSACFVALAHGLNDAQKSMGIITLGLFAGGLIATPQIPMWVILACAVTIAVGTASGGMRIIKTMGFQITKIDTMQGFAAEASASIVILGASFLGMPISSTQMIAGSITGVGSAKGMHTVKWGVPQKLVIAWFLTLPGAGLVSAGAYLLLNLFLS